MVTIIFYIWIISLFLSLLFMTIDNAWSRSLIGCIVDSILPIINTFYVLYICIKFIKPIIVEIITNIKNMIEKIKKFFRELLNSKEVTKKDYKNSEELIKERLKDLKNK